MTTEPASKRSPVPPKPIADKTKGVVESFRCSIRSSSSESQSPSPSGGEASRTDRFDGDLAEHEPGTVVNVKTGALSFVSSMDTDVDRVVFAGGSVELSSALIDPLSHIVTLI